MKRVFLLVLACVLLFHTCLAEENIADLRITRLPVIVKAGSVLDFSFSAGNRVGPSCTGNISYWIEVEGKRISKGSDMVFLKPGAIESGTASVLLPSDLDGIYEFFIEMKCNDTTVLANKTIEVKEAFPALPLASGLEIVESTEEKQFVFKYQVQTSGEEPVAIHVEERITDDNNVLWANSQNIPVFGSTQIERFGPMLPPGKYKLVAEARFGQETARMTREFSIKAAAPAAFPQEIVVAGFMLALFAFIALALKAVISKSHAPEGISGLTKLAGGFGGRPSPGSSVCPVESESAGVTDSLTLHEMLDEEGYTGKKREKAEAFAERTPVQQAVRGCILVDKKRKMQCETTVEIKISNNTNRNWTKLVLLASVPDFLSEDATQISSECEMEAKEGSSTVRFSVEKVGAMQSAVVSYSVPKMVSQAEANSVQLPAVVYLKEGKPLTISQVRVEKQAEKVETEEKIKEFYKSLQAEEKGKESLD